MRILIYYGKHGEQYWLADTKKRTQQAQRALFDQLDAEGCYEDDEPFLEMAREGDPEVIDCILTSRQTCEYECWDYEELIVPDNEGVPGEAELQGFNVYQKAAHATAVYPRELGVMYAALGLAGESGETAEKILELIRAALWVAQHAGKAANQAKKVYRDDNGVLTPDRKKAIAYELGGVLWYTAELATMLGVNLATISADNLRVLAERQKRNTIHGDGDHR